MKQTCNFVWILERTRFFTIAYFMLIDGCVLEVETVFNFRWGNFNTC